MSTSLRVLVAGAGIFGSAIALALARAGARVFLADPATPGDNASGVAAGMLAPAFEALTDEPSAGHYGLLSAARDLWPDFLGDIPQEAVGLRRCGALWLRLAGDPDGLFEARRAELQAMGAAYEVWSSADVVGRVTGLSPNVGPGLFTPEDWRLAPAPALAALRQAAETAGADVLCASVTAFEAGRARLSTGETVEADRLVLATGANAADLAPELAALAPIKGQILRFDSGFAADGPTLRCAGGYASGGGDGLHVGATMEIGRRDRDLDPATVARLRAMAEMLNPALAEASFTARAGVRATSPDGLPMVGPSVRPGVLLAAGARRNGWLLAPLVARMIAASLTGGDPGAYAKAFDARRFG